MASTARFSLIIQKIFSYSMGNIRMLKGSTLNSLIVGVIGFFILISYGLQLQKDNEYIGYVNINLDMPYLSRVVFGIILLGIILPKKIIRPSDFFAFLYGFFVLLPYVLLSSVRGEVPFAEFVVFFMTLVLPLLLIKLMILTMPVIRVPGILTQGSVIFVLCLFVAVGIMVALSNPTPSAGFDFSNVYERRLEGRDIFISGSLFSYLSAANINGFSPFIAFWACWKKKYWLLVVPILCWLTFFYLLGVKAPLLFICVAALLGMAANKAKIVSFISYIYWLVMAAFCIFAIEYSLNGYSYVADYFIRRSFAVPPWVMSSFFEFMSSDNTSWSLLNGALEDKPISLLIGEDFLGMDGLNANTNAFIYSLGAGGIPLYFLTIALVGVVFLILDSAFSVKNNPSFICLGFSYAILVIEQAATTALLSSGIGMLIALMIFSKRNMDSTYAAK
ncbi:hypothetical protein [Pseudomonas fildesensis]|nr:hypothetical protein [Pseudomonas fildesensis]